MADQIQMRYKYARRLHWSAGILLAEIAVIFIVGFIPHSLEYDSDDFVSFARAARRCRHSGRWVVIPMQVPCASVTGEVERQAFSHYLGMKNRAVKVYFCFGIIFLFASGAGLAAT